MAALICSQPGAGIRRRELGVDVDLTGTRALWGFLREISAVTEELYRWGKR